MYYINDGWGLLEVDTAVDLPLAVYITFSHITIPKKILRKNTRKILKKILKKIILKIIDSV